MDVLDEVIKEHAMVFDYPDEKIASNLYLASLSKALGAIEGMCGSLRIEKEEANKWLERETENIHRVPVLDFDNITKKLKNGKTSCDAFFYNFCPLDDELHYLAEMKNANKKTVLALMEDNSRNGIYRKLQDSIQMILKELEFKGAQEREAIVEHTHFFMVYAGKNDVPVKNSPDMPGKTTVERDGSGKQRKAGRMQSVSRKKDETETYDRFSEKIQKLRLAACSEDTFPGDALPRLKKIKGSGCQRSFSLFSARDFAEIVDAGFFSDWKWGSYQPYL